MKKIILILMGILCLMSCTRTVYIDPNTGEEYDPKEVIGENDILINGSKDKYYYEIIDVTINNETHQYLLYRKGYSAGIAHWEGCKYCKEDKNE